MALEPEFQTVTMAQIYAQQGHYKKAVEIYKNLLEREPNRQDLAAALSEVEKKLSEMESNTDGDLADLLGKWIELILIYKGLHHLKVIKSKI